MSTLDLAELERQVLGSSRSRIDVNSNLPLTQSIQPPSTYRTPYPMTSAYPYTTTPTSYYNLGYPTVPPDNQESKKALHDVNDLFDLFSIGIDFLLVTRSNSCLEKRFRKKR